MTVFPRSKFTFCFLVKEDIHPTLSIFPSALQELHSKTSSSVFARYTQIKRSLNTFHSNFSEVRFYFSFVAFFCVKAALKSTLEQPSYSTALRATNFVCLLFFLVDNQCKLKCTVTVMFASHAYWTSNFKFEFQQAIKRALPSVGRETDDFQMALWRRYKMRYRLSIDSGMCLRLGRIGRLDLNGIFLKLFLIILVKESLTLS